MRKYFTWRCIGLHALALVLVPAFLLAAWWQYHVALGGNDLSWLYTVEWPFFAVYAVYVWWRLIHDRSTLFDRMWAARQRVAADEEGRPLHEIPGWALDEQLSREVHRASLEAARRPAISAPRPGALDVHAPAPTGALPAVSGLAEAGLQPASSRSAPIPDSGGDLPDHLGSVIDARDSGGDLPDHLGSVIDARVLEVKVAVDEELDAYNRYLFELSRNGPPKRWGPRGKRRRDGPRGHEAPDMVSAVREQPALPSEAGGGAGGGGGAAAADVRPG